MGYVLATTIKRALNSIGYSCCKACKKPFIPQKDVLERKAYVAQHLNKPVGYWRHKIYEDKASFNTSTRGSHWVTRLGGDRYNDDRMEHTFQSGRTSVMVFGATSYNWKSPLTIIEGSGKRGGMTFKDYVNQVLIPVIAPALNGDPDSGFLAVDEAPHPGQSSVPWNTASDEGGSDRRVGEAAA